MTGADIATGEIVEPTVAALATTRQAGALVRPVAGIADVEAAFHAYQELYARLLAPADFQVIGGKRFAKKSAWRKLSVAFGVTFEIADRAYERDERGRIVRAEIIARAIAPNGRYADGIGACDLFEKCCDPATCKRRGDHKHCTAGCPGSIHFSNPQHDLPATAETRAKNRAASDLFGMGEVSAEEINAYREEGWWGGWADEDEMRAAHDPWFGQAGWLKHAPAAAVEECREWRKEHGLKQPPFAKADFVDLEAFLRGLRARQETTPVDDGEPFQ